MEKGRGMEKIIRNYDQFGSDLVYFIEINVIVCNVYSAPEYCIIFATYASRNNPEKRQIRESTHHIKLREINSQMLLIERLKYFS